MFVYELLLGFLNSYFGSRLPLISAWLKTFGTREVRWLWFVVGELR